MIPAFLVRFVAFGSGLPVLFAVPAHGQNQFLTPELIAEAIRFQRGRHVSPVAETA